AASPRIDYLPKRGGSGLAIRHFTLYRAATPPRQSFSFSSFPPDKILRSGLVVMESVSWITPGRSYPRDISVGPDSGLISTQLFRSDSGTSSLRSDTPEGMLLGTSCCLSCLSNLLPEE